MKEDVVILTRSEWVKIKRALLKAQWALEIEIEELERLLKEYPDDKRQRQFYQLMIDNFKETLDTAKHYDGDMR